MDSETMARSEARRGQSTDEHGGNETKLLSESRAQWVKTTRMGGASWPLMHHRPGGRNADSVEPGHRVEVRSHRPGKEIEAMKWTRHRLTARLTCGGGKGQGQRK